MLKLEKILILFWIYLTPTTAFANDGFGGLSATGLQFSHTDAVRMVREDLFLSPSKVEVRYLFHNQGSVTVRGEVIFPLPPISLSDLNNSEFALDQQELQSSNPVHFTVRVNGMPIAVRTERRAILEPPYSERAKGGGRYDHPGKDITHLLQELHIPLSLNPQELNSVLQALSPAQQQRLVQLGLVEIYKGVPPTALWSIQLNYHWPQSFPAGKDMVIEHSYIPAPPGGIFIWPESESELYPYQKELIQQYCIDGYTRRGIVKRLYRQQSKEMAGNGMAIYLDYVLTTANTWHGPIDTFHLTIDKGSPNNILSLCLDGLKKTDATRFELTRKNFRPDHDLQLLFIAPIR
nr:DUF4424 family protein [uncultured Desulfobulbus sp.]